MEPDEIRKLDTNIAPHYGVGGTGREEELRNLLMREIAAQLSEMNVYLQRIAYAIEGK